MDLWQYLSSSNKKIVMYGMGNGADKIIGVCERYGIEISDFFASDGFVRGQIFHGKTVLSFSQIKEKYGKDNIIVLVAFASSLPDVMDAIARVAEECETYIPDVPVRGDNVFCEEFEREHKDEIEQAFALLSDERSREVFQGVIDFRRTGRIDILQSTSDEPAAILDELLHFDQYRIMGDIGAYNGDTAEALLERCPLAEKIYSLEPDRRNFRKLSAFAEGKEKIVPINAASWDENTTLYFDDAGNRNSGLAEEGISKRRVEVNAIALDGILADGVDYIKYDVEGAEKEALEGSREVISKYRPDLLISIYHRTEDLHALVLQLHEICPDYKLFIRRYPYIPAWDLNLYATVK